MAWLLQQQEIGVRFWIGVFIIVAGATYCGRLLTYDVINGATRVRELESEINRRAGEKLLLWESERGGLNPAAKLTLRTDIKAALVILADGWAEKNIADTVACDQSRLPPRAPDSEVQAGGEISRVQVLLAEWPGLANSVSIDG